MPFTGVYTALVTPFDSRGGLDLDAYKRLLLEQRDAGVSGVVPCGTTGETPTLTLEEKKTLISTAITTLKGSEIKVLAGTGSNSTAETVEMSRWASDQGAHGVLVVVPYYNKPSQAGLEAHFTAVADAVSCPVMLYNVPGRTVVSLTAETIVKLAAHPRICSIKEATGNPQFASEILDQLRLAGRELKILSGDDATYLPLLATGGHGVVSVASNLLPRTMVAMQRAVDSANGVIAIGLHQRYYPMFRDLFVEPNPVPIKYAMAQMGYCEPHVRLPLVPMSPPNAERLDASMRLCGVKRGQKL